jgi:asparagine synthetase B (glutamine-hydrolysing)
MCGFLLANFATASLLSASDRIASRGPDLCVHAQYRSLSVVHYLLSITKMFRMQPLISEDGNIICVFNGELYNQNSRHPDEADGDCLLPLYQQHGPEFVNRLDGEFALVIVDFHSKILLSARDTFGTKPLWVGRSGNKFCFASYESALRNLGMEDILEHPVNSLQVRDLSTGSLLNHMPLTSFNLNQHKTSYDDWIKSFENAVLKRCRDNVGYFVGLSSGYDSGAIASVLEKHAIQFQAISLVGTEDPSVLEQRHKRTRNRISVELTNRQIADYRELLENDCEPFTYLISKNGTVIPNETLAKDPGAIGLAAVCERASQLGLRVGLSGQGADEIISDYGNRNQKLYNHSSFGGLFPKDLSTVFPWPSFFNGTQRAYLGKEERVLGRFGLEGRYPFLDRELVQEFLWLDPSLKNARYKAPIAEYLDRNNYPYSAGTKYGFSVKAQERRQIIDSRCMALCTTSCDGYIEGTEMLIKTFLSENIWFEGDFVVLCWGNLSEDNKCRIHALYSQTRFIEVDLLQYQDATADGHREWNYIPAVRFEMFSLSQYNRVVYVDSDVVVVKDIRGLFETPISFGACALKPGSGMELRNRGGFNAGVLTVGPEFLTEDIRKELLTIAKSQRWSGNQTVLNLLFEHRVTYLPPSYNVTTDLLTDDNIEKARIIHFIGHEKPWHSGARIGAKLVQKIGPLVANRALQIWDDR